MSNLRAKLKHKTECRDIADLEVLTPVLAAQNRAIGKNDCTDLGRYEWKKSYGTAGVLSHESMPLRHNLSLLYIKLSDSDRIARRTRRPLEAKWCKTEGKFVNLRRR